MNTSNTIAKNWLRAFNEHHLENLLALYHSDAIYFSTKLKIRLGDVTPTGLNIKTST